MSELVLCLFEVLLLVVVFVVKEGAVFEVETSGLGKSSIASLMRSPISTDSLPLRLVRGELLPGCEF